VCPSGPTAVIEVAEGATVAPRTTLHLTGAGSLAGAAPIVNYVWTVQQPGGSVSKLKAGEALADQTFVANVVGAYVFSLSVTDADGVASCALATTAVEVVPVAALHIEVLWDTPGDPDPSDQGPEAGSDVDVHFAHPFAKGDDIDGDEVPDGWFDSAFDCYWLNAHPNWGSLDPEADDDPSLDREDTDGAGPEIISLPSSAPGLVYRVGVHLWNAHGKGPSTATVRVYFQAALVGQWAAVLNHQDFWEVATIEGATGAVSPSSKRAAAPRSWRTSSRPSSRPDRGRADPAPVRAAVPGWGAPGRLLAGAGRRHRGEGLGRGAGGVVGLGVAAADGLAQRGTRGRGG
jgi:hypothetical protein